MRAEIISVGTELLLGDILNTNAQYLAQELAALGFSVFYQTVVGDNPERLTATVREAKGRSEVLLLTGGLGPTDDDLTKQTVAAVFNDTLARDPEEAEKLESFFCAHGRHMGLNNLKQADIPVRGGKFENPNGTAPGVWFEDEGRYAFLMPGPPREMRPMFENGVRRMLLQMQDAVIESTTLRVFGIGESDLENKIHPLLEGTNPTAALYAKTGEVHIRVTAKAPTLDVGVAMCAGTITDIRALLGDTIYSENGDDLETVVVNTLRERGQTLATAESCTGGKLSARITSVPGASEVFGFGVCTYANEAKKALLGVKEETLDAHGAVSAETAREMARGARKLGGADYGVGITGVAGPGGGTPEKPVGLVYVAAANRERVWVKKLNLPGREREFVRTLACHHALDMVRRLARGLEMRDMLPEE